MPKTGICECGATLKLPDFANDSHATCRMCGADVKLSSERPSARKLSQKRPDTSDTTAASAPQLSRMQYEPSESIVRDVLTYSLSWVGIAVPMLYLMGYLILIGSGVLIPLNLIRIAMAESVEPMDIVSFLFTLTIPVTGILTNATAELMSAMSRFLSSSRS